MNVSHACDSASNHAIDLPATPLRSAAAGRRRCSADKVGGAVVAPVRAARFVCHTLRG